MSNRCSGLTKDGEPCRAFATEGGLCYLHANPTKAAKLGRQGGLQNRRRAITMDPLPALNSAAGIGATLERVIPEVYSGQLAAARAAILGPLLKLKLLAIELTNFEQGLKQIEQRLEQLNQDQTSVPKLQQRIKQLEQQLAKACDSSSSNASEDSLTEGKETEVKQ